MNVSYVFSYLNLIQVVIGGFDGVTENVEKADMGKCGKEDMGTTAIVAISIHLDA